MEAHVVLTKLNMEPTMTGNYLIDNLMGAKIYVVDNNEENEKKAIELENELRKKGKNPYRFGVGGSNILGTLGYVNCFKEILQEEKILGITFDYIFFSSSSYGTHSGLIIGNILNERKKKIYGISTSKQFMGEEYSPFNFVNNLVQEFNKMTNYNLELKKEDFILDLRFSESGYAVISNEDKKGILEFARNEGILVDPVYTGRAAGGMIEILRLKEIPEKSNVLFLHTGGGPAIFTDLMKF